MSNTDKTYTNRYNILRGQLIYNFHLQNPTKRLEGPSTPASIITAMNNSRVTGSCCSTSIPVVVIDNALTILVYDTDQGSSVAWNGNTFTRNTDLQNFSYTATITSTPEYPIQVPSPANLISVTIGNLVTSIGNGAFYNCPALTSVTFRPTSTLETIDFSAFQNCSSLISITIPDSVQTIDFSAFQNCSSLISITIPNSVTSIGAGAFTNCVALTSITIPDSVQTIGNGAFYNCAALTSVTIPNLVTSIGNVMFANCIALTSITIGNSVTSIGDAVFDGCIALTFITIPNSVTSIDVNAFTFSGLTTVTIANGQLGITSPTTNPPGVAFFGVTVATILP